MTKEDVNYFELMIAGIGGQGALIIGRLLADAGMQKYTYVSYFPSYAMTMRGGGSQCTVILSINEISAPAVLEPSSVILMDPSALDEFGKRIKSGGLLILDSSLVTQKVAREDLRVIYLPATRIATGLGNAQVANFILLGAYLEATKAVPMELCESALDKKIASGKDKSLLLFDSQALREGARLISEGK